VLGLLGTPCGQPARPRRPCQSSRDPLAPTLGGLEAHRPHPAPHWSSLGGAPAPHAGLWSRALWNCLTVEFAVHLHPNSSTVWKSARSCGWITAPAPFSRYDGKRASFSCCAASRPSEGPISWVRRADGVIDARMRCLHIQSMQTLLLAAMMLLLSTKAAARSRDRNRTKRRHFVAFRARPDSVRVRD
jgi:hypothetical protein